MAKKSGLNRRRNRIGILYILPWIIGFFAFQAFPFAFSFYMSLNKWDLLSEPEFIQWGNYLSLIRDPKFLLALKNTFMFMFFSMVFGISISLFIAALLAEKLRGVTVYRAIFYLPNLVVPVAFGMMMRPIFGGKNYGLLNLIIGLFGAKPVQWLENPDLAIWMVIITNFWYIGASMIIFLAGIKNISPAYYETAKIDGAGWFKCFFYITIPLLKPIIFFQTVTGLIYALQIFDIPMALADMGASLHTTMGRRNSLATLIFYLYMEGFRSWRMGRAASIGWVVFLIGVVLTLVIVRFLRSSWTQDQA